MCWKNLESPSDKALDRQTTHTYIQIHTHIHTAFTHFPPRPHCRVYIYLSLFFSFLAFLTPQTSEGIEPSLPHSPLLSASLLFSPLCLSSLLVWNWLIRFSSQAPRTNFHLCRFTLKPVFYSNYELKAQCCLAGVFWSLIFRLYLWRRLKTRVVNDYSACLPANKCVMNQI